MEHPILLVYIWGIYGNVKVLLTLILITSFGFLIISGISRLNGLSALNYTRSAFAILIVTALLATAIPTRNAAILMVAAPALIKTATAATNSKAADQIANILNNSLNYLENRTKDQK